MDLKLDNLENDLVLENGDLALISNADAVAQFLKQKFKTFLTEWFLDENVGVPYFDRIFIKNPKQVEVDSIFKGLILGTVGVEELVSYDAFLNGADRKLELSFVARTRDGLIDFSEIIEV